MQDSNGLRAYYPHLLAGLLVSIANADNWPQWRGPDANSVAKPGDFPTEFSNEKNVIWTVELPGKGSSAPAVWEDQIFVTGGDDGQDSVQSYNWNGELLWDICEQISAELIPLVETARLQSLRPLNP